MKTASAKQVVSYGLCTNMQRFRTDGNIWKAKMNVQNKFATLLGFFPKQFDCSYVLSKLCLLALKMVLDEERLLKVREQ